MGRHSSNSDGVAGQLGYSETGAGEVAIVTDDFNPPYTLGERYRALYEREAVRQGRFAGIGRSRFLLHMAGLINW